MIFSRHNVSEFLFLGTTERTNAAFWHEAELKQHQNSSDRTLEISKETPEAAAIAGASDKASSGPKWGIAQVKELKEGKSRKWLREHLKPFLQFVEVHSMASKAIDYDSSFVCV